MPETRWAWEPSHGPSRVTRSSSQTAASEVPSGNTLLRNAVGWTRNPNHRCPTAGPIRSQCEERIRLHTSPPGGPEQPPWWTSHLLAAGSDPNTVNARLTPYCIWRTEREFHSAVFSAKLRTLSVFLDRGADFALTPLHRANLLGDSETAMSNARTENGLAVLHLAADPGMVGTPVTAGAEIDVRNALGRTSTRRPASSRQRSAGRPQLSGLLLHVRYLGFAGHFSHWTQDRERKQNQTPSTPKSQLSVQSGQLQIVMCGLQWAPG